jgi:SP family facilitated glucose transporter-like MFS transporter 8
MSDDLKSPLNGGKTRSTYAAGGAVKPTASLLVFAAVGVACLSALLFGFSIAFTSPAQATMQGSEEAPSGLNVFTVGLMQWYASLINVGCVVGAFAGSAVSDRFGRKIGLACAALPQLFGWSCQYFVSQPTTLIALRMLIGLGVGMGSAVTPVYIGEVAPTSLRGSLGACNQLMVTIGIFLANFLGSTEFELEDDVQTYHDWRGLAAVGGALSAALFVGMLTPLTPETPCWMAKQGNNEGTLRSLERLRRQGTVAAEAHEVVRQATSSSLQTSESGNAASGFSQYRKSYIIALGLLAAQQFSGVNAIMMYTAQICAQAGMDDPTMAAMISMLGQVFLTFVSVLLMERAGRRGLLLFGTICMGTGHCMMAYYFIASPLDWWAPSWLALSAIGMFLLGFSLGLGPIPWLIMAEIIPTEARGTLSALGTALCWASSFVVTLVFNTLEETLTKQGTFLLFAGICFASFFFVLALVPETKGKTVEQVMEILQPAVRG